ncbi:MAG TPA: neutral zinc metallopeptidase [Anaerolineae bacterium]|nr:zinc metallopeptidase [Ardenticatenia bacterium]MBK8538412.1 zinc metallopeptidase [Ardenticatenia bacterium]HQZ71543.1 neutral zinc metallopeptidase [Anaerolineae bacterium]HRA20924.1 neutral zinc metallopeptidase [Anaerolineae bacterium]
MRWQQSRRSENVEDRRSMGRISGAGAAGIGGLGLLIVVIGALFFGQDPGQLVSMLEGGALQQGGPAGDAPTGPQPTDEASDFVSAVLGDTEDTWGAVFQTAGERYEAPNLVLYTDVVQSACGVMQATTGPFYCPDDQKVYIDLGFMNDLKRMGVSGDFAMAYVISHEVGHHVQHLMGMDQQVRDLQARVSQTDANQLSVLMELQADCYAGVWANHAATQRQLLDESDVEEGLNAAASVGDDRLMAMAGRRVQPEAFTHGTSEQRAQWFRTGLSKGDLEACDTFGQAGLR